MWSYQAIILASGLLLVVVALVIVFAQMRFRLSQRDDVAPAPPRRTPQAPADSQHGNRVIASLASKQRSPGWEDERSLTDAAESESNFDAQQNAAFGRQKTILVADDDPVVAGVLTRRMQHMGFRVIRSPDCSHALLGTMKMLPDLVIMDINMPSGNGLAVCEMMACDQRCAHIPVIVHTVLDDEAVKQRCEHLGAHYVEKSPHSWDQIKSLVESLLGEHDTTEEAAAQPLTASATSLGGAAAMPIASATPADASRGAATAPSSRLVLCIEQPQGGLETIEQHLHAIGLQVSRVADPEEGFWVCFTEHPFAVVVQIADDKKTLLSLLARMSQHPVTKAIPVFVINQSKLVAGDILAFGSKIKLLPYPTDWEDLMCELEPYCPTLHDDQLTSPPTTQQPASLQMPHATHPDAATDQPADAAARPLTILCIDDDPVVAKSIANRVQPYSIKVRSATDGTQGYLMATTEHPDLVLLDLKMPNGDGTYALCKIKENRHTKNIPVIVLTIEKHHGVRRQLFAVGIEAYLNKPIQWRELFAEMSRCVHLPKPLLLEYGLKDQLTVAEL
jgi:CheY-like chemotaxis protein